MATDTPATDTHSAIDAVWRIEQAKLIAGLARMVRDVALAEELAQDALVAALEQWPASGIPDKPGAWLMTTAKRRAIDRLRRHKLTERKHEEIGRDLDAEQEVRACAHRRRARRRHRRRPAAPDVHRMPSGAVDRSAGRAHAAADRRPHHRRDRARLPGAGADHRAAPGPRQADTDRAACCVRGAARRRSRRAALVGARSALPGVQRGLHRHRRRRLDAAAALPGRDAPRPHPRRTRAQRAGGARPGRADGDPSVALRRTDRRIRRAGAAARPEPRALGPAPDPPRPRRARSGGSAGTGAEPAARHLRLAGRDRRLSCAGAHGGGNRLAADRRALRRAGRARPLPDRRSQPGGRALVRLRSGGRAHARRCDRRGAARSRTITCCRACAATCWSSSAVTGKRAPSSSARRR